MAASVYPSSQWTTVLKGRLPLNSGSDIWRGAPVRIASSGDWTVVMCQTSADKPIGVAEDYAQAGKAVTVLEDLNITRTYAGAGASFSRQSYLGVIGTSSGVHPQSGVTVTYPVLGQVTGTPSIAVGASTAAVWAVGVAYESAAAGDAAAFRVEPRLLSGLVLS